jgi:hypothetical protein
VKWNPGGIKVVGITCSRPAEEYVADFAVVGRRALRERPLLLVVFDLYILEGLSTACCLRKLKIQQNVFFRRVFQIKQELGRAFREVQPYPLFPLAAYNNATPFYDRLNLDENAVRGDAFAPELLYMPEPEDDFALEYYQEAA